MFECLQNKIIYLVALEYKKNYSQNNFLHLTDLEDMFLNKNNHFYLQSQICNVRNIIILSINLQKEEILIYLFSSY